MVLCEKSLEILSANIDNAYLRLVLINKGLGVFSLVSFNYAIDSEYEVGEANVVVAPLPDCGFLFGEDEMSMISLENGETDVKNKSKIWIQYVATFVVNLGAFSIGSLLGWTSQTAPKLKSGETGLFLTDHELSWMAGWMPLGAAFSAVPIPFVMKKIGRKMTLIAVVPFYVLGFAILAWAVNVDMYYAGRFITGMSGGAFSIVSPLYTAEIGEKHIRGSLGTYYEFMLAVGVEFSYVVGGVVSVFWLCIICGIVPIIFASIFLFMPESPYYYVSKNKINEATKSLKWFRGKHYDIATELEEIIAFVNQSESEKLSWELLKSKAVIKSIFIAFCLMVFQQFGGANAVVFNTTTIFQEAGSTLEPSKATMIVGMMQFGGNFLSMLLIDRLGRRILLLLSGAVMGACTLVLGLYFHWLDNNENLDSLKWLPLTSLCVFMIMFSIGWGPVAWMMLGELFPTNIKGVASSFSCATNWVATFLVTKYFPDMIAAFGQDITFWIFTAISALGVAFVYFVVPETKGKTLDEIQRDLSGISNKSFVDES